MKREEKTQLRRLPPPRRSVLPDSGCILSLPPSTAIHLSVCSSLEGSTAVDKGNKGRNVERGRAKSDFFSSLVVVTDEISPSVALAQTAPVGKFREQEQRRTYPCACRDDEESRGSEDAREKERFAKAQSKEKNERKGKVSSTRANVDPQIAREVERDGVPLIDLVPGGAALPSFSRPALRLFSTPFSSETSVRAP